MSDCQRCRELTAALKRLRTALMGPILAQRRVSKDWLAETQAAYDEANRLLAQRTRLP